MGIMSTGSRIAERPKPPTLEDIEDDLLQAKETDMALVIGEEHLQTINFVSTCSQSQDSSSTSSNLNSSSSSVDSSPDVPQAQVKESYSNVLRLIELYSHLKEAPSELVERISKLKVVGDDMSESIAQLTSLSESLEISKGVDEGQGSKKSSKGHGQSREKSAADVASSSKEKAKGKRKK